MCQQQSSGDTLARPIRVRKTNGFDPIQYTILYPFPKILIITLNISEKTITRSVKPKSDSRKQKGDRSRVLHSSARKNLNRKIDQFSKTVVCLQKAKINTGRAVKDSAMSTGFKFMTESKNECLSIEVKKIWTSLFI